MNDYKALVKQARMGAADGDLVTASDYADVTERLADAVEALLAKLDMPCGSCHPCTQWANQTWVNAGVPLPHLSDWQELVAERDALRAQLDNTTTEWGYRDADGSGGVAQEDEKHARVMGQFRELRTMRRLVGPWVEVTD